MTKEQYLRTIFSPTAKHSGKIYPQADAKVGKNRMLCNVYMRPLSITRDMAGQCNK